MGFFSSKTSEEKAAEQILNAKADSIILTTLDLKYDYDILDIIWSDEVRLDLNAGYEEQKKVLKNKAASIGADAVIGVKLILCNEHGNGMRRWYGTAVKFRR